MYLFFDTETSGFAKPGKPARIVQLAALLTDQTGEEVSSINTIIKPEGWKIDEGAFKAHGISDEHAAMVGLPIMPALLMFQTMLRKADTLIAHNISFDMPVIESEFKISGWPDLELKKAIFCTMKATTNMCRLPGRYGNYKWPKLIEAYQFLFKESFDGQHDALADVRACKRIFFELKRRENEAKN